MKNFFIVLFLFLINFSCFAQTPTNRANFLTEKMNVLLNLSAEQLEPIQTANFALFERELEVKEEIAQNPKAQQALAGQLSPEMKEKVITKLTQVKAHDLNDYNELLVKPVLSKQQYSLYIQNQTALLQDVIDQFGE